MDNEAAMDTEVEADTEVEVTVVAVAIATSRLRSHSSITLSDTGSINRVGEIASETLTHEKPTSGSELIPSQQ